MSVLYFTVFAGIESVLPCTSDLGVTIQIGFRYAQHGGDGEFKEVFLSNMQESAPHGDVVLKWTRSFSGMKSAGTGCFPHYFLRKGQPEPIALFPWCMHARFLGESLPMLWKCEVASTKDASRPTARPITEGTKPQETTIYLKAQSN